MAQVPAGLHKTGIRGIQDTRQIVDGKTNDFGKISIKAGHSLEFDSIRQLMLKAV